MDDTEITPPKKLLLAGPFEKKLSKLGEIVMSIFGGASSGGYIHTMIEKKEKFAYFKAKSKSTK